MPYPSLCGSLQWCCWLQVLALSRDAFERLMGPVEEILAEQITHYDWKNVAM